MGKKYTAKTTLRDLICTQRKQFTMEEKTIANHKIADKVEKFLLDTFLSGMEEKKLGAYYPLDNEPGGRILLPKISSLTKHIFLPIPLANSRIMHWGQYKSQDSLALGEYQIPIPTTTTFSNNKIIEFNLLLVPGLAFDIKGNRLGKGKGYYDQALESIPTNTIVIGLSFDNEIFNTIPHESWDKKVDFIITPTRLLDCRV